VAATSRWFLIVYLATNAEGLDKVDAAVQKDMKSTASCNTGWAAIDQTQRIALAD
jgi:hypothetical protein